MVEQGWIMLHRCIRSNWIWNEKPFSRGQAFIDLLLMVNHEDKKIIFNGTLTEVKRGSCITSIRKLGEKWGWSNKKVKMFLEQLKLDQSIDFESNTKRTLVTVENYSLYQSKETPKKHQRNTEESISYMEKDLAQEWQEHGKENENECTERETVESTDITVLKEIYETPKKHQSATKETQKHNKSISKAYQKHTNNNDKEYINNDNNEEEGKEASIQLSFPSSLHETLFNNFGEVGYKTWFINSDIKEDSELITITVSTEFIKNIIQNRYSEQIGLLTGKKVSVKVG